MPPDVVCLTPWDNQNSRIFAENGIAPTLSGADGGGGRNPAGAVVTRESLTPRTVAAFSAGEPAGARSVAYSETTAPTLKGVSNGNNQVPTVVEVHPRVVGTLLGSAAGLSRPAGVGGEPDYCIAYALQGSMIGREDKNGPQGSGVNEEVCFTLNTIDRHAVAAVDCRNAIESANINGTLQAKSSGGTSLNLNNTVRTGYIVRRLTPTECERLMSFPDGWTEYGHDGRQLSDSARYQALGNSIVVNVLCPIMRNIAQYL
jgi:DNA (cytosine-5)-methyltransferase 1